MFNRTLIISKNPKLAFEHKPLITFINKHGQKIKYNSLGFIGDEIGQKDNYTFRILGIGDSITAAEYLREDKSYLNIMAKALREREKIPIQIINAGVGGYNSWQELELIKQKGATLNPDLIIVGICPNDYVRRKTRIKTTWFNFVLDQSQTVSKARYLNILYQNSSLYRVIYDSLHYAKNYLKEKKQLCTVNYEPESYTEWKSVFEEMILSAQEKNIKILFVSFPAMNQIHKGDRLSSVQLSKFFKEKNVYFFDLIEDFMQQTQQPLFMDILHPNELGHKITGRAIADFIIKNEIIVPKREDH